MQSVRFVPSRVEGQAYRSVAWVEIFGDRLVLAENDATSRTIWLENLAPRRAGLRRFLDTVRRLPRRVGERDWFASPPDRFFRFATTPPTTIYMPVDDSEGATFARIREILRTGGFDTADLG